MGKSKKANRARQQHSGSDPILGDDLIGRVYRETLAPLFFRGIDRLYGMGRASTENQYRCFIVALSFAFKEHRDALEEMGIDSPMELFEHHLYPRTRDKKKDLQQRMLATGADISEFFEWQEERRHSQLASIDAQDLQVDWEGLLQYHRDLIPESEKWDQQVNDLVRYFQNRTGGEGEGAIRRLLWSIVYIDIQEKTGPDQRKQGIEPRKIADIFTRGHITHRLEGEFRDEGKKTVDHGKRIPMVINDMPVYHHVNNESVESLITTYSDQKKAIDHEIEQADLLDKAIEFARGTFSQKDMDILGLLLEETSQQEIANRLRMNQSTVSRHIRAVQERLKKKFHE